MPIELSQDIVVRELRFGREQAPLMVIDNVVADPRALARAAQRLRFRPVTRAFPGIRALAPAAYQRLRAETLGPRLAGYFGLTARRLHLSLCHYSLVTLRPEELTPVQRIPHVDTVRGDGLATVHYLFESDLGGTAFYRHRATGFESVDAAREDVFVESLKSELEGPDAPPPAYINGDTALFERIEARRAVFNRMLVYRRNSLHSGSIPHGFEPDPDPATGRLSINSFIDPVP